MRALVAVLAVFGMAVAVAAQAAEKPAAPSTPTAPAAGAPAAAAAPQPAEIVAGGMVILRLRVTIGGKTPQDRAGVLYERLNGIVSDRKLRRRDYQAVRKGDDWLVMAGPHLFVTVTDGEAKANKTPPKELAQTWASNLRRAVSLARPIPLPGEE